MEDGLLSLKWNNHKSTFFHILSSLRKKETYTDATLACEGKFFPVHKLVMSTCSDYFCEVFENTNCKSPVVILKDIKYHDLEALLDYMYLGEVDVKQNELAGLIKAAECLRIKGLAVPDEDPALSPKKTHIPESRLSPSAKRARRENVSDASSNAASCSNLNHHSLSPSRSHSSTISTTVPSQSVNSDTLPQVPSLSLPPSYTDKRHSNLSVNDNQKHIDQSDIVPVEMIKVEVDDENSSNSQLQQSKDRPIGQSGSKDNPRGEGSGNNNIEESHRDRDSISNNFSDYSAGNQSTDIEKEEHDQIDPFNESDQVAGPSGVQGGSQIVNWGEEEGSFPHNLFGNEDSSHQQVCIAIVEPEMLAVRMFQGPKPQYVMNHSPLQLTQEGERNSEREKTIGHPQDILPPKLSPSLHQLRGPEPHYVVYQPTVQSVDQFQKKNSENLHQLEIIHSVPSSSLILSTPTISSPVVSSQIISPSMQNSLPPISVMTHEKPASSSLYKKSISSKKNSKPKTSVKRKMPEQANYAKHRKTPQKRKKKLELLLSASKENFKNEKEKIFQSSHENMPLIAKIEISTASEARSAEMEGTNADISQEHLASQLPEVDDNPIHQRNQLSPRKQDSNLTSLNLSDSSSSTISPQDLSNRQHRLHQCPYCQYHSKSKVDLNKHIRVHTKEKPYKCNLCKYETGDKSNFKRHITCVHKCEFFSAPNSAESLHSSVPGQQVPTQASISSDTSARETVSIEDQEELQQEQRHHQHFPVILDPHQNVQERPATIIEHQHPLVYSSVEIPHHSEIEPPPPQQPIPSMQIHSVEICSSIPYSHPIITTPAVSSSSTTP